MHTCLFLVFWTECSVFFDADLIHRSHTCLTFNYYTFILLAFVLISLYVLFQAGNNMWNPYGFSAFFTSYCIPFQNSAKLVLEPKLLRIKQQNTVVFIQGYPALHSSITCYCYGLSSPQAIELLLNRVIRLKSINPHLHLPPGSWQSSTHLSKKQNAPTHTLILLM